VSSSGARMSGTLSFGMSTILPPPPRRRPIGRSRGIWGTSTSWKSSGIRPAPSPV
jgi:hypothetical protein